MFFDVTKNSSCLQQASPRCRARPEMDFLWSGSDEVVRLIGNLSDGKAINEKDIPTKIVKLANLF